MNYKEAKDLAKEINSLLQSTDPRMKRTAYIKHHDGTKLKFESAFMLIKENWLMIFPEHHGWHVYDTEDLEEYYEIRHDIEELADDELNRLMMKIYTYKKDHAKLYKEWAEREQKGLEEFEKTYGLQEEPVKIQTNSG